MHFPFNVHVPTHHQLLLPPANHCGNIQSHFDKSLSHKNIEECCPDNRISFELILFIYVYDTPFLLPSFHIPIPSSKLSSQGCAFVIRGVFSFCVSFTTPLIEIEFSRFCKFQQVHVSPTVY